MARFEGHLTFDKKHAMQIYELAESYPEWKFSQIKGCPMMGPDKTYCYLTGYDASGQRLLVKMANIIADAYHEYKIEPLRTKIERIVFDSKTGVDEL